jgi:formate hydrogenlyase subunit 3/multisubunit Na+/H+ antiporter MnhD subunit
MISLHTLLVLYQNIVYIGNLNSADIAYIGMYIQNTIININALNINLVQVYYYPFIYVFLLITILSIIFCLSYNQDELSAFMFFCLIILVAGYTLFFTDSLIIFFFSYEMLLVPSFFILYKFAKTRRCVEAAYLMFF